MAEALPKPAQTQSLEEAVSSRLQELPSAPDDEQYQLDNSKDEVGPNWGFVVAQQVLRAFVDAGVARNGNPPALIIQQVLQYFSGPCAPSDEELIELFHVAWEIVRLPTDMSPDAYVLSQTKAAPYRLEVDRSVYRSEQSTADAALLLTWIWRLEQWHATNPSEHKFAFIASRTASKLLGKCPSYWNLIFKRLVEEGALLVARPATKYKAARYKTVPNVADRNRRTPDHPVHRSIGSEEVTEAVEEPEVVKAVDVSLETNPRDALHGEANKAAARLPIDPNRGSRPYLFEPTGELEVQLKQAMGKDHEKSSQIAAELDHRRRQQST